MQRTQIYLEPELAESLDRLAKERGTSRADLIRTAARRLVAEEQHPEDDPILGIMGRLGPPTAQALLGQLLSSLILQRVHVVEAWEDEAERLHVQFHEQRFSYVDATSFVTMRYLGIQEALAFDTDFMRAGFMLAGDE